MANGKGDKNRTTNLKNFRENYSEINWRGKNDCKFCGQPMDKHTSCHWMENERRHFCEISSIVV